jgi:hypothetical protein
MENVVTVYHGGSVEEDEFGNVIFDRMEMSLYYLLNRRCIVRCLVGLVMWFNAIQIRMPSQLKGSFTTVNPAEFSDGWSQLNVRVNGRSMSRSS